jgi:CRP/FNR family cyclic AMP-dependent transcriptional regulator
MIRDPREVLRACPLFQDLGADAQTLADLAQVCERQSSRAGEIVIAEGSEGDTMFVIQEGRVRVEKRTPVYRDSYTVTALDASTGGFFGELALLDREQRSASVVAESDCHFLVIRRERFLQFGDRHPLAGLQATRRIAEHLAARLRRANDDIGSLFAALVEEIDQRL